MCFGLMMVATAAFSTKPWEPGLLYDTSEDLLHSITATTMGFGFTFGVLFRFLQRESEDLKSKIFDFSTVVTATFIPLFMAFYEGYDGITKRLMFLVSYIWYTKEIIGASEK